MGRVLFIKCINDVIDCVEKSLADHTKLVIFADDTNPKISEDRVQSFQLHISKALEVFFNWFTINGLEVNA